MTGHKKISRVLWVFMLPHKWIKHHLISTCNYALKLSGAQGMNFQISRNSTNQLWRRLSVVRWIVVRWIVVCGAWPWWFRVPMTLCEFKHCARHVASAHCWQMELGRTVTPFAVERRSEQGLTRKWKGWLHQSSWFFAQSRRFVKTIANSVRSFLQWRVIDKSCPKQLIRHRSHSCLFLKVLPFIWPLLCFDHNMLRELQKTHFNQHHHIWRIICFGLSF